MARYILLIILFFLIAVRFAGPVVDGDLFFHMAYGKYMLDHKTLIPDHSIYSWTPTEVHIPYCAWISQIFFYLLYLVFGLSGIFILRYLFVLISCILIFLFAKKVNMEKNTLTYLYTAVFLLSSYYGTYHKPELFSFLLFNLSVWIYFNIKTDSNKSWLLYFYPLIILFWVNCHGGFVFGLFFIFLMTFGEALNALFYRFIKKDENKEEALFPLKDMIINFAVSFIAIILNPYGYQYPMTLFFSRVMGGSERQDFSVVADYQSIFHPMYRNFHYIDFFIFMIAVLSITFYFFMFRNKKIDFSLIILNCFFAYIFTVYLRSTYFWPAICIYTLLYLQKDYNWISLKGKLKYGIYSLCLICFFFFSCRAIYDSYCRPFPNQWLGFGISYQSPVCETEFLKKYHPGSNLFNDYDTGGYLIWALYPKYKVFIDGRAFPYTGWFYLYQEFMEGKNYKDLFLAYPCDTALVSLRESNALWYFTESPYWSLVFYGPSAAVFVKKEIILPDDASRFMPERFDELRDISTASYLFVFTIMAEDYERTLRIFKIVEKTFIAPVNRKIVSYMKFHRDAVIAYKEGKIDEAINILEECRKKNKSCNGILLYRLYKEKDVKK